MPRYQATLASAGDPNAGLLYVDLADIRTLVETARGVDTMYTDNVKPYLDPLDRFVVVVNATADSSRCACKGSCSNLRSARAPIPRAPPSEEVSSSVAVRIRLTRVGATKQPTYRFVVADSRSARDGRSLDTLGHYNPRSEPIEINVDAEKAAKWLEPGRPAVRHGRAPVPPASASCRTVGRADVCRRARRVRRQVARR